MPPESKNSAANATYTEENIKYLDPREHVRLRPGMYVGGTDSRALHHLIYEVVDNSIDEALAGRCDHIQVVLHDDGSVAISDNGAGIPVGMNKELGISTLEGVMTKIGMGGKFDSNAYKVSGGLHGVGVSAVNALSAELYADVYRNGFMYRQVYREGLPQADVEKLRPLEDGESTGTTIRFWPDFGVMDQNDFSYPTLATRFREMAFVTPKVTLTLRDERVKPIAREITYYFDGGLGSFVRYLNRNRRPLHDIIHAERDMDFEGKQGNTYTIGVEVAFQYTDGSTTTELAFTNTINTPDGGTHITGLRSAITGVINRHARKLGLLKEKDSNFSGNDTLEGLTAIVSVKHPDPQFESQTKVKLLNQEVQGAVSQVVTDAFNEFLELNPRDARRIIDKCMTSKRAREAARKARDLVRSGPSLLESSTLPGKLADCSDHGDDAEIYIVEGDSAGGSAKQGRDRHFQAILPLRGKILNTERARLDKILDNNEIKAMISALGTGIHEDFDVSKLRYGRVIIMTDADVDGSHIRTLLLTFFFRHMLSLIQEGHLYIAQPPIYLFKNGKQKDYIYPRAGFNDAELLEAALKNYKNPERISFQRYKGLGEMNPDQLWETTMDPENRTLLQVTIEDAAEADRVFDMLMGSSVPPRRRFIQTNAKQVKNLDI
ncbi:type IIA DNA topoisomerase subunit B [Phototrophicus methaneseepsis]|uniref:DNA topoisomerase (ATP-hydrolyzing) n=1 Tax=Phototrophicus methaneseepsis TaxID=2710758 RepID=A0A7S8IDK6_9CHLR|nr:DNA topoisomerase subunit B [Phototrophicus methaneseepsis]QPC80908.1 type IIA DNA topoisomerase subunit B [Phototrophicus methaneseepsis]